MVEKKRTIFCDIDGTIFKYRKFETLKTTKPELTPGALEKLEVEERWLYDYFHNGTTRGDRNHTVKELLLNDIPWDKLIMGIERGPRYLINDMDPANPSIRAIAYSIERDKGLKRVVVGATEEIVKR